jgi:hypothetical protein
MAEATRSAADASGVSGSRAGSGGGRRVFLARSSSRAMQSCGVGDLLGDDDTAPAAGALRPEAVRKDGDDRPLRLGDGLLVVREPRLSAPFVRDVLPGLERVLAGGARQLRSCGNAEP